MPSKILIVGAEGQLGRVLQNGLSPMFNVVPTTRNPNLVSKNKRFVQKLDITNFECVQNIIKSESPNIIINCAAITNVDECERNRKIAYDVNVGGVKNLVKACSKNVKIIQISTDYVFDGTKGPYDEKDATYPINYYGRTKLEAENFLKGSLIDFTIIRASVLYGNQLNDKPNFFSWVYNSLKANNSINVVTDQVSNPVWLQTFIDTILNVIIYKAVGIYHLGSDDYISRYEFAVLIAKTFSLNQSLINPVDSKSVPFLANRPQNSGLKTEKIVTELNIKTLSTSDSLNFIKNNYMSI